MRAEIISVGTELLLGDILNTNARFLSQHLAALGYNVFYQTTVGDNSRRLRELVQAAKLRSDVLIFSGGLGPTADDITKEIVAEVFEDLLVMDIDELVKLEQFFKSRGVEMTENNKKQALVPKLGRKIVNGEGTAPGAFFRRNNKYAFLLPGPPREMQPMFLEQVVPMLEAMQDAAIRSVTLRCFGIGESALEDKIASLLEGENPTAALYAKTGEVHVRITARADTAEQAEVMCDEYAVLFYKALGDLIYATGEDDMATATVNALIHGEYTVATAESCTGGLLGERITAVPGSSAVYGYGAITYANMAKHDMVGVRNETLRKYGAVSSQVAAEMAFGVAKKGGSDFGIGITGIAGPGGGTPQKPVGLVYIAVSYDKDVYIRKLNVPARSRDYVREISCLHALDMMRRMVLGLPVPNTRQFTKNQLADFERDGAPRSRNRMILNTALAILGAVIILMALIIGIYSSSNNQPSAPTTDTSVSLKSQGLQYGTREYTQAAFELVANAKAENPAMAGFVAIAGQLVETLVAQTFQGTQNDLEESLNEAGVRGYPVMASDVSLDAVSSNTLILGQEALLPIVDYQYNDGSATFSTFTFYTDEKEYVYNIIGVYMADDENADFYPEKTTFDDYNEFLEFIMGMKMRNLYDMDMDATQEDSYMTLAVQDAENEERKMYVCGRLVRSTELPKESEKVPAGGDVLMPDSWYKENSELKPNIQNLYEDNMREYLMADTTNSYLQLEAGMPQEDAAPLLFSEELLELPVAAPPVEEDISEEDVQSSSVATAELLGVSQNVQSETEVQLLSSVIVDESAQEETEDQEAESVAPSSSQLSPLPDLLPQKPDPDYLTVRMNGELTTLTTELVLAKICQFEVGAADIATIQSVAVAAHSWILNQQGAGNEAPAVVGAQPNDRVLEAVREVTDVIISEDEENPAFTPWFSMAAQATSTSDTVFGEERTYLTTVPSPHEQGQSEWREIVSVDAQVLAQRVDEVLGVDLLMIDEPEVWLSEIVKDDGGYVKELDIGEETVSGMMFWQEILTEDEQPVLPSLAFEVDYSGEEFVFICYGQGFGCGMSLVGAEGYAQNGWEYTDILTHYFPDTKLMTW